MGQQIIIAAILGACLGSFLNVAAHRSIQGRKWWGSERSVCESCGHVLTAQELIPVVSWIMLRGKCKSCGARISVRYILVEVLCAFLAAMIVYRWGMSWACVISCVGTCGLVVNSLTDFEAGEVFDMFSIIPGVMAMLIRIAGGKAGLLDGFYGALVGWGIFAAIIIMTRGGMGWGDAVFMGGMGAVLGLRFTLLAFYLGVMIGGAWVIVLLIIGRVKWGNHDAIPLVPFLAAGCFITIIYGSEIFSYLAGKLIYPEAFITVWPFN